MPISVKRAYLAPEDHDGYRVLVDRIWPRGLSKESLRLGAWLKELAPSNELRRWFGHDLQKWEEFRNRYWQELEKRPEELQKLLTQAGEKRITLVFAARDEEHNNAVALKEFLEMQISQKSGKF